jgi:hypothetical protein
MVQMKNLRKKITKDSTVPLELQKGKPSSMAMTP